MAINLQKGQRIEVSLSQIEVGLGWSPAQTGHTFDLDVSVFLLNDRKYIPSEDHFVFYGNTTSPDGSVQHSGDERSGNVAAGGDDESIQVNLSLVEQRVQEIVFVVTIHDFEVHKQNFGQIRNAYIRICDKAAQSEIAKYELDEDFSIETALEFGRLYKRNNSWKFEAMGLGYRQDLSYFVEKYSEGIEVIR